MTIRFGIALVCCLGLVACEEASAPSSAPAASPAVAAASTSRLGAGQLPAASFPLSRGRVVSQSGDNTAMVEVRYPRNFPAVSTDVRNAARAWCGREAFATPVSTRRTTMSVTRTYVVRCQ